MTSTTIAERYQRLLKSIESERNQVVVQLDLERAEMQREWQEIEKKLDRLHVAGNRLPEPADETSEDFWQATSSLGQEVRDGYQRIKRAVGE